MRATLLGTGCPVVHAGRRGAATLIEGGTGEDHARVLVDCGSGVTQRLVEAGTRGADIDLLVLTHLHSDHLVDFYQLVISSWHQGRDRPWRIAGPAPVIAHVHAAMDLWEDERARRIAFEQRSSVEGLRLETQVIDDGALLSVGEMTVTAVAVEHPPVVPALGFVFEARGRRIVHSGDTRRCRALIEAGRGADLLIHEVFLHRERVAADTGQRTSKTMDNVASYHTLSSEVGGVADAMGARALALTHFVPPDFDRAALLAEVGADFAGPVFVGEDLMRFDLSAGTVAWRDALMRVL